jgi:hypothetical protein
MATCCTVYAKYCREHNFVHGAEAEELRQGVEKLIAAASETRKVSVTSLRRLLDRVDARDSLAFREAFEAEVAAEEAADIAEDA